MSWFQKNYEKAALGGAVAVALGLAFLGYSKFSGVATEFLPELTGTGKNNPAVQGAELIPKALQSLKIDHKWVQAVTGKDRSVDLFVGIPLFVPSSAPE